MAADFKFEEFSDEILNTLQQGATAELERREPKVYLEDIKLDMTPAERARVRARIEKVVKGLNL